MARHPCTPSAELLLGSPSGDVRGAWTPRLYSLLPEGRAGGSDVVITAGTSCTFVVFLLPSTTPRWLLLPPFLHVDVSSLPEVSELVCQVLA